MTLCTAVCAAETQAAQEADYSVDHFLQYLKAQDEGYDGPFQAFSRATWPADQDGNIIAAPEEEEVKEEEALAAKASETAEVDAFMSMYDG